MWSGTKIGEYKHTEYEEGNLNHEAIIELAAKLHWGLKTEVTLKEYEEEERRQRIEEELEDLENEAENEHRQTAATPGESAETLEDIDLEMLEQNKIEKWLGLEAKLPTQTSTEETTTEGDKEINQEKQIEEEITSQRNFEIWFESQKETENIELTEEEQIALEIQKQNEFGTWIHNLRIFLNEHPENNQENEEDTTNLFWSDSD